MKKSLKEAFTKTLPIMAGYVFLGMSFGLLATNLSISPWITILMSVIVYSGATQFAALNLLTASFNPLGSLLLSLMVSARHVFYGITMLPIYSRLSGWRKIYSIFGLTDETFSLNVAAKVLNEEESGWFYFFTSLLNQSYWVLGTVLGVVLEQMITINIEGIEFILVAMFVAIFTEQWIQADDHKPALIGLGSGILSLLLFGSEQFMIPAMFLIVASMFAVKPVIEEEKAYD
ncbi:MAG TPA: AzlC family ABC transporter permease [Atopostipes sp.]|nr:AzlC family ABC transporter permease [Atopostipes sp.]